MLEPPLALETIRVSWMSMVGHAILDANNQFLSCEAQVDRFVEAKSFGCEVLQQTPCG